MTKKRLLIFLLILSAFCLAADDADGLLSRIRKTHYQDLVVTPGSFTYEDTGIAGPFSLYIQQFLRERFTAHSGYTLFDYDGPAHLSPEVGKAFKDVFGAGDMQTLAWGKYYPVSGGVKVWLEIFDLGTHSPISSGEFVLPSRDIPEEYPLLPERWETAMRVNRELKSAVTQGTESGFSVYAALDKGSSPVYRLGDELTIYIYANQDAYIKVYHTNAEGEKSLIFPNRYHPDNKVSGGDLLRIPNDGYPFRFSVTEPLGVEQILVAASPSQFKDIEEAFTELSMETVTRGITVVQADASRDEEILIMTVME
ncbi:MAG: DUF4384 domain-containing protein [Spirochaetia bacterium]